MLAEYIRNKRIKQKLPPNRMKIVEVAAELLITEDECKALKASGKLTQYNPQGIARYLNNLDTMVTP